MSKAVISVEHLSKQYDLGVIGTGTLSRDLNRWWARVRKKPDPYTRIGQQDAFARIGESILALDDVSFTVQQGEALGIIGRNGAGKSTLLKILSRVTAPTSGMVKVKGRIGSLLEVGTGFHPELTGRENVYLNGAILGMRKEEVTRKFDEIVDFAGVEKFIDTPVKRYSSGMYVRLAFAVAAHLDPEILIVDEVLAVGDAEFQKKCLGKMGDVASEGRTVLFVSHNMGAIQNLCQRTVLLKSGSIEVDGPTSEVINSYLLSSANQKANDLRKRTDRKGRGEVQLIENFISTDGKNPAGGLVTGSPAWFVFQVSDSMTDINCKFTIVNSQGIPVVHFNSTQVDEDSVVRTFFKCYIDNLVLSPGHYTVNVMIFDTLGVQDHITESMSFIVDAGQQNGKQVSKQIGYLMVCIPHRWIIQNHEGSSTA